MKCEQNDSFIAQSSLSRMMNGTASRRRLPTIHLQSTKGNRFDSSPKERSASISEKVSRAVQLAFVHSRRCSFEISVNNCNWPLRKAFLVRRPTIRSDAIEMRKAIVETEERGKEREERERK